MRKLLAIIPAALTSSTVMLTPVPAAAAPTCEQQVRIRCSGYDFAGQPRLDIYYDSYEACVRSEQPTRCGTQPDDETLEPIAFKTFDLRLRKTSAMAA